MTRNLVQYPITSEEVIDATEYAYEQLREDLRDSIGTTVPYSLYLLCEFIREEEPALIAFLEKKAKQLNGS